MIPDDFLSHSEPNLMIPNEVIGLIVDVLSEWICACSIKSFIAVSISALGPLEPDHHHFVCFVLVLSFPSPILSFPILVVPILSLPACPILIPTNLELGSTKLELASKAPMQEW